MCLKSLTEFLIVGIGPVEEVKVNLFTALHTIYIEIIKIVYKL